MSETAASEGPQDVARPRMMSRLTEHPALAASVALIMLSLIHVLFVARFDLSTATSLLTVANTTQLLLAAAARGIVIIALTAVFNPIARSWLMRGLAKNASRTEEAITAVAFALGIPVAAALLTPLTIGIGLVMALWIAVQGRRARRESIRGVHRSTGRFAPFFALVLLANVFFFLLSMPWSPREEITLDSEGVVLGHVVGEQADQMLILNRDRSVQWIRGDSIHARRLCGESTAWWWTPLRQLIGSGGYEPC